MILGLLLRNWQYVVIATLSALFFVAGKSWTYEAHQKELVQAQFDAFKGQVEALGKKSEEEKLKIELKHQNDLENLRHVQKIQLTAAVSDAVNNYRMHQQSSGSSTSCMSQASPGDTGNDGAINATMATDAGFIQECARTVAKLNLWQQYGRTQGLEVE